MPLAFKACHQWARCDALETVESRGQPPFPEVRQTVDGPTVLWGFVARYRLRVVGRGSGRL